MQVPSLNENLVVSQEMFFKIITSIFLRQYFGNEK